MNARPERTETQRDSGLNPAAVAFELFATRPRRFRSVLIGRRGAHERREAIRAHLIAQHLADLTASWDDAYFPAELESYCGDTGQLPSWGWLFKAIYHESLVGQTIRSRASDPATSHVAAARFRQQLDGQKLEVLRVLRQYPNSTPCELATKWEVAGMDYGKRRYAASKRLPELEREGWVRRSVEARDCTVEGTRQHSWEAIAQGDST